MECNVSYGELSRMIQFKDKSAKRQGEFISAGLFTYPALQAADILLYDADEVPVGDDQRQHVEITREIAVRFNHRFGDTFVLPEAVTPAGGARVMDLQDPTSKMSKSAASDAGLVVQLLDEPDTIARKFKRAVTDSENEVRYDPAAKPGVSNLLEILAALTGCDARRCRRRLHPVRTAQGRRRRRRDRGAARRSASGPPSCSATRAQLADLLRKGVRPGPRRRRGHARAGLRRRRPPPR